MSDGGDCRTALATPGLLNITQAMLWWFDNSSRWVENSFWGGHSVGEKIDRLALLVIDLATLSIWDT